MQCSEQIESNLIGQKRVGCGNGCDPDRAPDEDETLAVDVCDAAPNKQEAAEGERVRGNNPLEPSFGDVESFTNSGKDNDDTHY